MQQRSTRILQVRYLPLMVLVGVALLATTMSTAHGQTCAVQYQVGSNGSVYPGGTFTLTNTFTNSGNVAVQVTAITLTTDIGTFSDPSSSLPLTVQPGSTGTSNFDVQVPSSASQGAHQASATASIQCFESGSYVTPNFSPLIINTTLNVAANPATNTLIGSIVLGVIVALVVAVITLVIRMRKRKQAPGVPAPTYMPPPSPPPTQSPPSQQTGRL